MKRLLPVAALSILTLAGCANTAPYSGDVYRGNQAQTGQSVSYGTIVAVLNLSGSATDDDYNKLRITALGSDEVDVSSLNSMIGSVDSASSEQPSENAEGEP